MYRLGLMSLLFVSLSLCLLKSPSPSEASDGPLRRWFGRRHQVYTPATGGMYPKPTKAAKLFALGIDCPSDSTPARICPELNTCGQRDKDVEVFGTILDDYLSVFYGGTTQSYPSETTWHIAFSGMAECDDVFLRVEVDEPPDLLDSPYFNLRSETNGGEDCANCPPTHGKGDPPKKKEIAQAPKGAQPKAHEVQGMRPAGGGRVYGILVRLDDPVAKKTPVMIRDSGGPARYNVNFGALDPSRRYLVRIRNIRGDLLHNQIVGKQ